MTTTLAHRASSFAAKFAVVVIVTYSLIAAVADAAIIVGQFSQSANSAQESQQEQPCSGFPWTPGWQKCFQNAIANSRKNTVNTAINKELSFASAPLNNSSSTDTDIQGSRGLIVGGHLATATGDVNLTKLNFVGNSTGLVRLQIPTPPTPTPKSPNPARAGIHEPRKFWADWPDMLCLLILAIIFIIVVMLCK